MQSFCRTCFLQISDSSSSITLDHQCRIHQLIFCIPEMDLRIYPDVKLCKECTVALDITYKFKTKCHEVEDEINKEQFNVIKRSKVTQDSRLNKSICIGCGTCHKDVTDNTFCLSERLLYKNKLMFCVPEMDLQMMLDINLCNKCCTVLDKIYEFKIKCLDIEKNIKEYLKLHKIVDFKDLSVWCNTFVKLEVSCLGDFAIKQEEVDLINEVEVKADVKEHITNATLLSIKNEELKICDCVEKTSNYSTFECICDNMKHIPLDNLKNNSKYDYNNVQKYNLFAHVTPPITGNIFKCSLCEYSSTEKSNLKKHIRTHTGEKPFKCSLCHYSAANKSTLQEHIYTHTGEKPHQCSLCEYTAANKYRLKMHIRTHTGEKPFKCSLCKYSAAEKSTLQNHIRRHTGEKPFKCSLCEYSAAKTYTLQTHIRTHTREKPFKCSVCKYSASNSTSLKTHTFTHTGERPFKCSLCEYSAAKMYTLKRHICTHTGEKPFKCLLCGYSAVDKTILKIHIRTHT